MQKPLIPLKVGFNFYTVLLLKSIYMSLSGLIFGISPGFLNLGAAVDVKCYVLKSTLPEELRKKYVDTQEGSVATSLTLLVVSVISLCGEKVPEGTFVAFKKLSLFLN